MRTLVALLGVSAIALSTSSASAWTPLDSTYPVWPNMPVQYRINEATIPMTIAAFGKARLDQGLAAWAAPSCTFWQAQNAGNTTSTFNYNDAMNVFMFRSGTWPGQLGDVNSVIGVTMPVWDNNANIYDADIVYNNVGFCWNDNGLNNCVDTLSIATHEEGHFLGLGHTNIGGSTMYPSYGGGNEIASIEQDDIDGVCALYPAQGTAASSGSGGGTDCNTCANASTMNQCSTQYNACGSSQQCIAYYNCVSNCSSQACADQCAAQYPQGASLYGAVIDCACSVCAVECSMECGGSGSSSSSSSAASSSSGSNSSSSGMGGNGGEGGSTGAWSSDDEEPPTPSTNSDGSCACSMEPSRVRFGAILCAAALGLGLLRRRNRRS